MSFRQRLARMIAPTETRSADPSWRALAAARAPTSVSPETAQHVATACACVGAISTAIASLPVFVFRRSDEGREVDDSHPLARLIRRGPNPHQTWPDFAEWLSATLLLRGNSVCEIVRDGRGAVVALEPIPPRQLIFVEMAGGAIAYDVSTPDGRRRRLLRGEVAHFKDRTDDGRLGVSRLTRASPVFASALAVQQIVLSVFERGGYLSGVLEHPGELSPEAAKRLEESFSAEYSGPANAGKTLVLEEGMKWTSLSFTPEQAEVLSSRRFAAEEIARIFQVPPPLVGIWDNSSFTNSETAGRWFAQYTLQPIVRKIEAEFTRSVFSEAHKSTHELEIDLSGFKRGDPEQRWAGHAIAAQNRILTRDEIREAEGYGPHPDGEDWPRGEAASEPAIDEA